MADRGEGTCGGEHSNVRGLSCDTLSWTDWSPAAQGQSRAEAWVEFGGAASAHLARLNVAAARATVLEALERIACRIGVL